MQRFLDIIFPPKCLVCQEITDGLDLCSSCLKEIFQYYGEYKQLDINNYLALFKYSAGMKRLIEALKYRKNKKLLPLMSAELIKYAPTYPGLNMIIPVPLNPLRLKERGFNQTQELIQSYARLYNVPVRTDLVLRSYNTNKLYALKGRKRLEETSDVFEVWQNKGDDIQGKNILIFDDIITTGGTVRNVLKVLSEFRPKSMFVLAYSRPVLENDNSQLK
jgi:ComF family protein